MSELDKLLALYCPYGVPFAPLGDVVRFINGRAYKQSELLDVGKYKVLRVGNFYTNGKWYYSDLELEEDKYCDNGDLLYTWAATIGPQIWNGEKVIFHYHIWKLEFDETVLNKRFLYHYLQKDVDVIFNSLTKSTMPHISMSSMVKRVVPIPPLPVQREIVRILDNFTELTAELSAELTARKQQYEYYTQHLLVNADGLECKLGDVATLKTGRKPEKILEEETSYEYINAGTSNSGYVDGSNCDGDTTTTPSRGQGGIGFVGYQKNNFWLGPLCYRIKSNDTDVVLNKFIYFYLKCFPELILQYKKEGGTPSVNASDLVNIPIIIPDIKEQKRIISVLSHFETICTDISTGLPAEIEARQKQYEYYRDKLLTFTQLA